MFIILIPVYLCLIIRVEPQILDYQTQQMKLFPAISSAYALFFTGLSLREIYMQILDEVQSGDVSRLAEVFLRIFLQHLSAMLLYRYEVVYVIAMKWLYLSHWLLKLYVLEITESKFVVFVHNKNKSNDQLMKN